MLPEGQLLTKIRLFDFEDLLISSLYFDSEDFGKFDIMLSYLVISPETQGCLRFYALSGLTPDF